MKLESENLPYWKSIWLTCSGVQQTTARDAVKKDLNDWKDFFLVGLHQFKSQQSEDIHNTKKKSNINEKLWDFVKRLSSFLDVTTDLAWSIITQYLLCEFHGTPTTLQNLTLSYDASSKLLRDIWYFYTSERMFYLKTLKFILEYHTDVNHPYHHEFMEFIEDCNLTVFRESLITQLKLLISININTSDDMNAEMQFLWIKRNLQEQIEILQCISLTHKTCNITPEEFISLLELFSCHRFGTQPIYFNEAALIPQYLQRRLTDCEIALLLCILDSTLVKKNVKVWDTSIKKDIDNWITRLSNEYGDDLSSIVLSWMLIRFNIKFKPNKDIVTATLKQLHALITSITFKDKSQASIIVRKSVYNLLHLISNRECEEGNEEVYTQCLSEVLKDSETATHYWKEQDEEMSIPREKWFFPYDFSSYSLVANGLALADNSSYNKVLEETHKLPGICLPFSQSVSQCLVRRNNIYYFGSNYYVMNKLIIPEGSVCIIESEQNPKTVHVQSETNYWIVFSNLLSVCINSIRGGGKSPFEEVENGLQFWLTILNNIKSKNQLTNDLIEPLDNTFELFNELLLKRNTNTKIYALIIEIMAAMHKISITDDICEKLRQYSFFPVLVDSYLPFEQLVKPTNFIQGRIFELILDYEIIHNKYYLLEAYLKFLRVRFEQNKGDYDAFEIPGIIFILQDILPKFSDWRFDIGSLEQTILYNSITLLFDILREPSSAKNNNLFQVLQKICIFDLLHITNGKVILNIVARGNRYLELIMQSETNWVSGQVIQYLHIVQMSLTILMLLFQKKSLITSRENDMPLEVLMFTQPKEEDTLQIIRNIASYMDHIFHKQLPVLSCRILRKFALKIQISLHGCFDMDSDQIRHVFIHRLRNKEESNDLKIAILDFIIACVKKQPGLTQTFFSKSSLDENNKNDEESLLSLMEEFLDLMSSETEFLGDPTLRSMMSLFHELWKNQKQVVVSVMRNSDKFWDKLCSPLKFKIISSLIKSYSQIFNIISIELYMTIFETDANLKSVVKNILNPNEIFFQRWINYIFKENISSETRNNCNDVENSCPHWLSLLQSWKDFMNIIINRYPYLIEDKAKSMIGHACLIALVDQINIMEDSRVITVLSELYILMLAAWKESIFDNHSETIEYLAKIVLLTHNSHRAWHRRIRSAVLSMAVCMTRLLKDEIKLNEDYAMKIFNSACKLACDELNSLETYHRSSVAIEIEKSEICTELSTPQESILKINLLNEILIVCQDMTDLYRSCVHMKLCLRLVQCLESIVQVKHHRPITLTILDCVMHLVKTRYADEFLSCELSLKLWLKVLPPKELMVKNRDPFNETLWTTDEWWPLYQRVILIVGLLLRKLQSRFLEDALSFVVIHDSYLIECLSLIRQSIDLNALNVVESTVTFVCEIMQFQKQWKPYHAESYIQIIKALTASLYCTIALLLRPNHIQNYKFDNTSNVDDPMSQTGIIEILNKLIDLVTKITQVLLKQSPSLMALLCNHCSFMEPCSIILDLEFNLPTLRNDDDVELSFGTIMAAINLLSRALQQIYIDESKSGNTGTMSRSQLSPRKRLGPSIGNNNAKINSTSDFTDLYPSSPSINISNTSWFRHLDKTKSTRALEVLLTLLSSQTLIYLFDKQEPRKNRQLICREISSELGVFHEYVKFISRGWSSRSFEDYSVIPRIKLGCIPINENISIESRDLSLKYYKEELFNPYTLEKTSFSELRKQIIDVHLKNSQELVGSQSDGDPIVVLSKVKFDFPDYFIFISNLFVSICKREEY